MPSLLEYKFVKLWSFGIFLPTLLFFFSSLPKAFHSYLITPINCEHQHWAKESYSKSVDCRGTLLPQFSYPQPCPQRAFLSYKHVLEPVLMLSSLPMHIAQICQSKVTAFSAPNLWAAARIHGCDSGSSRLANNSVWSPDLHKVMTPQKRATHPTEFHILCS